MKLCIPVQSDQGLDSPVHGHFGSAPAFAIVDTDQGTVRALPNRDAHHAHGGCSPLAALAGEQVDCVVVGGIGAGALAKLHAAAIPVYASRHRTVAEALAAWKAGTLVLAQLETACAGHGHGGHGHGGGHCHGDHGHGGHAHRHGHGHGHGDA